MRYHGKGEGLRGLRLNGGRESVAAGRAELGRTLSFLHFLTAGRDNESFKHYSKLAKSLTLFHERSLVGQLVVI